MNSQLYRSEVPGVSRLLSLLFVFCAGDLFAKLRGRRAI